MPLFAKNSPGTLDLSDSNSQQQIVHNSIRSIDKPLPKSPSGETAKSPGASKLSSFFGWGGQTSPAESDTTFSDDDAENKSFSPIPSPGSSPQYQNQNGSRQLPQGIDTHSANEGYFDEGFPSPSLSNVGEMESELRAISAELATSIRREMELEDLVEGLQSELEAPRNAAGRRTSDYFSDSGNSSLKYGGDVDARADEVDRQLRKVEREKAQIRLECQEKVQEERERRKGLEKQIRQLEEKASQVDLISINSLETSGRLKDLEATCEDLRRRLAEEKQVKENFEDLLSALKSDLTASHEERDHLRDAANEQERLTYQMQMELGALKEENNMLAVDRENLMHQTERLEKEVVENHRSESDDEGAEELIASLEKELEEAETERNALRDDVVPKLKKRLQGLETESQSHGKITADLQSQVKTLTNENAAMASAKKAQDDLKHLHSLGLSMGSGMESIGEEGGVGSTFTPLGLKRSSSVVGRSPSSSGTPMRSGSRPTSMIFKNSKGEGVVVESRDQLLKKVKEVEAQRDALHDALRALLVRRKVARKDEEVRLRKVEGERDRAMARLQEISGLKDDADKRVGRVRRGERRFDAKMQQTLTIGGGEGGRMPVRITAPDF